MSDPMLEEDPARPELRLVCLDAEGIEIPEEHRPAEPIIISLPGRLLLERNDAQEVHRATVLHVDRTPTAPVRDDV